MITRFLIVCSSALSIAAAAELPVRQVTLYKHGVAYFERAGELSAGQQVVLKFKAEEMDDVLKSLMVVQQGGRGVSAIRYDSSDPLSKRLTVFPFRVPDQISLSQLLDQFKGSRIELNLSAGPITGTVVSARSTPPDLQGRRREELLLLSQGSLQTVDLDAASGIRFLDSKVQEQFQDYLNVLARSRDLEKRSIVIESQGDATAIAARYLVPTPIWKSSYRLLLGDEGGAQLEGWAIVDNTSGEDWDNVRLSLVSGLPVSFISRLYQPRYLQRPVIDLARDRAWRPVIHEGAIQQSNLAESNERSNDELRKERAFRQASPANLPLNARNHMDFVQVSSSTIASTAVGAELGELFEYAIEHPVTIGKNESAMLPFFKGKIEGRRLLIYDKTNTSQHPLNAFEIDNSTGSTLDGGALTIYDGGAYAGEALTETIKNGDKRLISYAVDLGTRITPAFDSSRRLQSEFHFKRGILTLKTALSEIKTLTIRNLDAKAKTLILEHPVRPGYRLIDLKPWEKTADAYRFQVKLAASETQTFPIIEEYIQIEEHQVHNLPDATLLSYVRNKDLSEEGRRELARLSDLKSQIAENKRSLERLNQHINELSQDQSRLRDNIRTLRSVSGQDQKVMEYSERLSAHESEIVDLRSRQSDLRRQADQLQRALDQMIETLEF